MKKRVFSMLLVLSMLLPLVPVQAMAEEFPPSIEEQIRAFGDSIDQPNADDTTARMLASHGMRGGGAPLKLDASGALTAALFNSELLQSGLAHIIADTIDSIQRLDMQEVPGLRVGFRWYGQENSYSSYVLTDSDDYPDNLDWQQSNGDYTGPLNSYDEALEWMVAGCEGYADIRCIRDSGSFKTYSLTITLGDRFDFSIANTSGFKQLLSGIGMLLFREFDWSCTVNFELTAPYSYDHCTHTSGAYHWTYDPVNLLMIADEGNGYIRNNATTKTGNTDSSGNPNYYYALENPIRLDHDKPWVIEYDVRKPHYLSFEPVDNAFTKTHASIRHTSRQNLYFTSKEYAMAYGDRYYTFHYYGTKLQEKFLYDYPTYQKPHRFRLENVIAADGSNMVHVTVTNLETGKIVLDSVPMDDHYYFGPAAEQTELLSEADGWLSGKDIHINFFGNRGLTFHAESLDLRIWENGENGGTGSYFTETVTQPTCTEDGCTTLACSRCGYHEASTAIPALGHSHTDLVTEPTCTVAGSVQDICSRCSIVFAVRELPATGHSFTGWEVFATPDCTKIGMNSRSCTVCGEMETEVVPAMGHQAITDPGIPATCTESGLTEGSHCGACGVVLAEQQVIPAAGHTFGNWETVTEPTGKTEGEQRRYCHCGHYESQPIPKLSNPFADVEDSKFYFEPVLWAVNREITAGTTPTSFSPNEPCTRAQIVTFLWRAHGSPEPENTKNPFTDVKESKYYYKAVLWAVEKGITAGTSATSFSPDEPCTRAQVATFIWRAEGEPAPGATDNPFADVKESKYFFRSVLWAVENGITVGVGDNCFDPEAECTRSQIVTFLYRAMVEQ